MRIFSDVRSPKHILAALLLVGSALVLFPAHAQAQTTDKLITVDRTKQMLYAWEGGRVIFSTAVSTGLRQSPTPKGTFAIERKYEKKDMRGISPVKGRYHLRNVPHTMFFRGGYAIHGAYWHTKFGRPASNGCVNVPLDAAAWLYNWAPMGTTVQIF